MTSLRTPLRPETLLAHTGWLRVLARSLVARQDCAEDVVQETLLVAAERQGEVVHSVRSWLAQVARNVVRRNHRRDAMRHLVEAARAREDAAPSAADVVAGTEMQQRVIAAVLTLQEPYRTAILLRFARGLGYAELARCTGVGVETVRTRIKRGLRRLRAALDEAAGSCRAWAAPILGLPEWRLHAATAGSAGAWGLIGVIMGKSILVCVALVVIVALFGPWALSGGGGVPVSGGAAPRPGSVAAPAQTGGRRSGDRAPVPVAAAVRATGSLRVRVVSGAAGRAAAGVGVYVRRDTDPDPVFAWRRARTDTTGCVRFDDLRPGPVTIRTERAQDQPAAAEIVAGSQVDCTVTLGSGLTVSGEVVDGSGDPVAGAGVFVERQSSLRLLGPAATTDTDGRFVLHAVEEHSEVRAAAPGHTASPTHTVLGSDGDGRARSEVQLRLVLGSAGGAIEGRVRGPSGAVAGAVVQAGAALLRRNLLRGRTITPAPRRVVTAPDGTFRIDGLPAGDVPLLVRAEGLAPRAVDCRVVVGGVTPVVVDLDHGVTCEGVVRRHAGDVVAGAEVSVGRGRGLLAYFRTATGADGTFRLAGLPAGDLEVLAEVGSMGRVTAKVSGATGATVWCELRLPPADVLRGRVLTAGGEPVAGVDVHVRGATQGHERASTDSEGRFVVRGCPALVTVTVSSHDFSLGHREDVRPADGELIIRVAGRPDAFVEGKVLDAAGRPLGRAMVLSLPRRGASFPPHHTADDGSFRVGPVPPGRYRLMVAARGHARSYSEERRLAAGETWQAGTIVLTRGGQVVVRLRSADGGSVADAPGLQLRVLDAAHRAMATLEPKAGTARSGALAAGRYVLVVDGGAFAAQSIPFEIRTGQESDVAVRLAPGVRCVFGVDEPGGLGELEKVRLTITGERTFAGRWLGRARGGFRFEYGLAPGRYTVRAVAESGRQAEAVIEVVERTGQAFRLRLR